MRILKPESPWHDPMSPAELEKIGKHLFGRAWHLKLAETIGVSYFSIAHWMRSTRQMQLPIRMLLRRLERDGVE